MFIQMFIHSVLNNTKSTKTKKGRVSDLKTAYQQLANQTGIAQLFETKGHGSFPNQ